MGVLETGTHYRVHANEELSPAFYSEITGMCHHVQLALFKKGSMKLSANFYNNIK